MHHRLDGLFSLIQKLTAKINPLLLQVSGGFDQIAGRFGVDVAHVRVLVQAYAKNRWQIGRRSAAAVGR